MPKTLRLILGDQLNAAHSWYATKNDDVVYVLMEMRQETDYVRHHVQKVMAFFAAMRNFAQHLESSGHRVLYFKLDDERNQQSLTKNISSLIEKEGFERFEYQLPDEYRLDEQLSEFCQSLSITHKAFDTEHFITERGFLSQFFKGKKTYLMESFYRHLRKKHGLLMEDEKSPVGGKWNLDAENRKPYDGKVPVPEAITFDQDLGELHQMLQEAGVATIGRVAAKRFSWPTSRTDCKELLRFFVAKQLPHFGTYEDAMAKEHAILFHSRLSFAMNTKMLSPLEVIEAAVQQWEKHRDAITLSQIEGFVRQILGWREYMRGVYWAHMPDYATKNFFNHQRKLPEFYWTGKTKMSCVGDAVNKSLDNAYAHHIQRLMVTGNFALLAGIDPSEVDAWYLGIYIDALEWVEITNTRGMSQFADGGIVGTKPYVSSANYIAKMSDYCKGCHYSKTKKTGEGACPFNSLYWHFYERNREKLERNPRIGMMYRTWDKMDDQKRTEILQQAEHYLNHIEDL